MNWKAVARAIALASALLASMQAWAAEDATKEQRQQAAELRIEEMKQRLKLTPDQEQRIAPLVQDRNAKMKALRERSGKATSRREKRAVLKDARGIQESFVGQVEPILTKDQMKEWEAIRAELRESAREKMRERQ